MNISDKAIKEAVAEELWEAMESINGPSITSDKIDLIREEDGTIIAKVSFIVQIVEEDDYIGICGY